MSLIYYVARTAYFFSRCVPKLLHSQFKSPVTGILVRPDQFFCGRSCPVPENLVLALALTLTLYLALTLTLSLALGKAEPKYPDHFSGDSPLVS